MTLITSDSSTKMSGTDRSDEVREVVPASGTAGRLYERISRDSARRMMLAWVGLFTLGTLVEPAPADPNAAEPLYATVIVMSMFALIAVTFAGLAARRRWGLTASFAAAGLFGVLSLACPLSGHHTYGLWWVVQMGSAGVLMAMSLRALGRRDSSPVAVG